MGMIALLGATPHPNPPPQGGREKESGAQVATMSRLRLPSPLRGGVGGGGSTRTNADHAPTTFSRNAALAR